MNASLKMYRINRGSLADIFHLRFCKCHLYTIATEMYHNDTEVRFWFSPVTTTPYSKFFSRVEYELRGAGLRATNRR